MATPAPWRDVVKICDNFEYMVRPETPPRVSRTTASAPPASESHPNRVHGSPPEGFNVRSFSDPGVVVVVAAMGRSNAERFLPRRVP